MKHAILIILLSVISLLTSYGQCSVVSQIQQGDCNTTCQGVANAVGSGISPLSYLWSNGDSGITADSLCANNTYYLTMTDSIGCTAYDTLIFPPAIVTVTHLINNASCSSCCDGTDTLAGIPSFAPPCNNNVTYQWFPLDSFGDTIPYRTNLCAQTYTVIISNLCDGCAYTSSVTIGYNTTTSVVNNQMSMLSDLVLNPNPSRGEFILELNNENNSQWSINMTDIQGKVILNIVSDQSSVKLNPNVENGIYIIHITDLVTHESAFKKMVIRK